MVCRTAARKVLIAFSKDVIMIGRLSAGVYYRQPGR
jgi:hypothetical protein